jgi:GTPase
MQKLDFLKNILSKKDIGKLLPKRPARFMIYESYIVGGVGSYVLGDVLCGVINTKENVIL